MNLLGLILMISSLVLPITAQGDTRAITPENAAQLEVAATLGDGIRQISFSPDGEILASVQSYLPNEERTEREDHILLWQLNGFSEIDDIHVPQFFIQSFTYHPDGEHLILGSTDGRIIIWNISQRTAIADWQAYQSAVHSVAVHPDGRILATGNEATSNAQGFLIFWDLNDLTIPIEISRYQSRFGGSVTSAKFHPDGSLFAAGIGLQLYIWDDFTAEPSDVLTGQGFLVNDMQFAPAINSLVAVSEVRIIKWDIDRIRQHDLYRYEAVIARSEFGEAYAIYSTDVSTDGRIVATGDSDGRLRLWNAETLDILVSIPAYDESIAMLRFHPSNNMIVTISENLDEVKVWQVSE